MTLWNLAVKFKGGWREAVVLGACVLIFGRPAAAQTPSATEDWPNQPALSPKSSPSEDASKAAGAITRPPERSDVSWKNFGPDVFRQQKSIWLFPRQVAQGKHLRASLAVIAATGAMVALDPHDTPYFRNNSGFNGFRTGPLRGRNLTFAIAAVPLGMYLGGRARHSDYAQQSALLAAESIVDTSLASLALKAAFGRKRPSDIPPHGDFTHTWFKYQGTVNNPGSFPSGHSAMAFGVASVLAARYRRRRWAPWLAYGAATFISLARIPDQAHFPSDVFAGAVLGYAVGHFVVMSPR